MSEPITPTGLAALRAEYTRLMAVERPAIVAIVSWAAGNGDRSENGDYIYGRQKLRDIDRRATHLARRIKAVVPVDPAAQTDHSRAWFGATVSYIGDDDAERTVTLVGVDESDAGVGRIGWTSPLARALRGSAVGDVRRVMLPGGESGIEVVGVVYNRGDRESLPPSPSPGG